MVESQPQVISLNQKIPEYLSFVEETTAETKLPLFARFESKTSRTKQKLKRVLPGCWSSNTKTQLVELEPGNLIINYKGPGKVETDGATLASNVPISKDCGIYYYEVTILDKGRDGYIAIGFTTNSTFSNKMPGIGADSWGYHASDGKKFGSSAAGKSYGPTYTTGDIIGCCINFADCSISFTRNGVAFENAIKNQNVDIYPCVGLRTPGESVSTNFGKEPFCFDIVQFFKDEKTRLWKTIDQTEIGSLTRPGLDLLSEGDKNEISLVNKLIVEWLVISGFPETAESLYKSSLGQSDILDSTNKSFASLSGSQSIRERNHIQSLIDQGKIIDSIQYLNDTYPSLLIEHPTIHCQLHCLVFIEMIKGNGDLMQTDDIDHLLEIVEYARSMKNLFKDSLEVIQDAIEEIVCLLCYEDPQSSPLNYLLDDLSKSFVSNSVNESLLEIQGFNPQSRLEKLYKQTLVIEDLLFQYQAGSAVLVDFSRNLKRRGPG